MTTSHAAHAKNRATFGGWRAQRPFWGGLFLILSGLELFLSGNLELSLEVHFGPTGFLSYVLPAMMLLCGLLTWFSPSQRLFYGILGTLTALYSLIGLNLGGFFLGMVLGLVGGGLAVAWAPGAPPAPPVDETEPHDGEPYDTERFDREPLGMEPLDVEPPYADAQLDELLTDEKTDERPSSGVLTDELPTSHISPIHGAGSAEDERPPDNGGHLPRRRGLGAILLAVVLVAAVFGATHRSGEAFAAPCGSPSPKTSAQPSTGASVPSVPASPSASPSPTVTQTVTQVERPGLLDWLGGLFGQEQADPTPTPAAPVASASQSPSAQPGAGSKAPSGSPSCTPATASPTPNNKKAQIAAGQPFVASAPSILKADVMRMDSLSYDGVAELSRKDGSKVKVLAFSMKKSVSTPFELRTPGAPKLLLTKSDSLTVEGDVKFYTTKFSANVLGILPLTFTPSFPPPPIPLPGFYTECTIELVYVASNVLTAPNLSIAYAT